jgi:beta-carotene 3-hydroxylase
LHPPDLRFLLDALCLLAGTAVMELVAWAAHRWVMHGPLWVLHEDHHRPHGGFFEKNDLFAFFFAGVSAGLIYGGARAGAWGVFWFGIGTALYGLLYTLFHELLFHQRIAVPVPRLRYLQRIIRAHRAHHSRPGTQRTAQSFGFLWASRRYEAEEEPG